MPRLLPLAVLLANIAACATAAAEPSQWRVTARCATGAERLLPGLGLFEVHEKSRDGNLEAIVIRGCGAIRPQALGRNLSMILFSNGAGSGA